MFGEDLDTNIYSSIESIKTNRQRGSLFQRHKYMFILLPLIVVLIIFGYFVFLNPSQNKKPISSSSTTTGEPTHTTHGTQGTTTNTGIYTGLETIYPEISDKTYSKNILQLSINSLESETATGLIEIIFKTTKFYSSLQLDSAHETMTVHDITTSINNDRLKTKFDTSLPNKIKMNITGTDKVNSSTDTNGYLYKITIKFNVAITNSMKGFYRSKASNGSYILSTQFEPNYAKYAYPAFDDPSLKSRFTLIITAPNNLTVLGNMPIKSTKPSDQNKNLNTVIFEETPLMSTYLSAWAIGKFNSIKGKTNRGLKVGIYTDKDNTEELQWALKCAIRAIYHYESILGVEYALPKVDMLSIPNFEAGAMENWGLITYREVAILASNESDIYTKIYVATVVIHELAHQWFGNLVTLKDWKNLWLNEGFASIFENTVLEDLFEDKEKQVGLFRNLTKKNLSIRALEYDGHNEVRALTPKELDSSKINQNFDSVAYAKGGSVLYQLKYILGDKLFYRFLNRYLNKHKFGNVTFESLRNDLSKFYTNIYLNEKDDLKYDIKPEWFIRMLEDVVYKEGTVLLESTIVKESSKKINITFKQNRFSILNNYNREDRVVPFEVTFYFEDGTKTSKMDIIGGGHDDGYIYEFDKDVKTVLVNQTGELYSMPKYYRPTNEQMEVMLKDENVQLLRSYMNYISLWLTSRQISLMELYKLTYYIVSKFISQDKKLTNKAILIEFIKLGEYYSTVLMGYLKKHLPETKSKLNEVKDQIKKIFQKIKNESEKYLKSIGNIEKLSFEKQTYITSFKLNINSVLIMSDDKETIDKYAAMFYTGKYDPNESSLVFSSVVKSGNPEQTYNKFIDMLKDKNTPVGRTVDIMMLLGKFDDERLMERTLDIAFNKKGFIKNQDRIYVLAGLARNPKFTEKVLEEVKKKWEYLKQLYKGSGMVSQFVSLFGLSSKKETIEILKNFVGNDETVAIALNNAIERIMVNYEYDEFNKNILSLKLKSN